MSEKPLAQLLSRPMESAPPLDSTTLQREQLLRIRLEAVSLDSTIVKVHPDGTGALKKTAPKPSASLAAAGPPSCIWLPRMSGRP